MSLDFHVIIPARYQSTRLPGKLLMELGGITVIERVYKQAVQAGPKSIIIATDSKLIAEQARRFGAEVEMTAETHPTGTDRLAEVVLKKPFLPEDIIVNVQGDEPFIAPELIIQVAHSLRGISTAATLCWPLECQEQLHNPHVVKVVRDCQNNAIYFSRAAIPFCRDDPQNFKVIFRHIGLYAYRAAFLLDFVSWPVSELETYEGLEQLRFLWNGHKIRVEEACLKPLQDINTEADLFCARKLIA